MSGRAGTRMRGAVATRVDLGYVATVFLTVLAYGDVVLWCVVLTQWGLFDVVRPRPLPW